jgi:hypothetical protein
VRYSLVTITPPDGERYEELRERKDGQWALYSDLEQQHQEYLTERDKSAELLDALKDIHAMLSQSQHIPSMAVVAAIRFASGAIAKAEGK